MVCVAAFSGAAYAAVNPLAGGNRDNHAPVEVTSDTLEVFQKENRAVFSGHVVAIQNDVRLKADKMTVHYRNSGDDKADAAKNPAENGIEKIDAEGSVFLSTPEETASGTSGVYDVAHQEIHLNNNVVLTRGKNTLKGDKLVYNFASGKSILTGGTGEAPTDGKSTQRVRALFIPEKKDDKVKK